MHLPQEQASFGTSEVRVLPPVPPFGGVTELAYVPGLEPGFVGSNPTAATILESVRLDEERGC